MNINLFIVLFPVLPVIFFVFYNPIIFAQVIAQRKPDNMKTLIMENYKFQFHFLKTLNYTGKNIYKKIFTYT